MECHHTSHLSHQLSSTRYWFLPSCELIQTKQTHSTTTLSHTSQCTRCPQEPTLHSLPLYGTGRNEEYKITTVYGYMFLNGYTFIILLTHHFDNIRQTSGCLFTCKISSSRYYWTDEILFVIHLDRKCSAWCCTVVTLLQRQNHSE